MGSSPVGPLVEPPRRRQFTPILLTAVGSQRADDAGELPRQGRGRLLEAEAGDAQESDHAGDGEDE